MTEKLSLRDSVQTSDGTMKLFLTAMVLHNYIDLYIYETNSYLFVKPATTFGTDVLRQLMY